MSSTGSAMQTLMLPEHGETETHIQTEKKGVCDKESEQERKESTEREKGLLKICIVYLQDIVGRGGYPDWLPLKALVNCLSSLPRSGTRRSEQS